MTDVALQHAGAWEVAIAGAGGPPALGPFLAARGDALLAGLDFTGAVWVGGDANATAPGQALLVAGDQVLLRDLPRPRGQRAVALALDAGAGTLTAHPAWPALIDNLVRARRAALPGPERRNVGAGEQVAVTLPLGERQLVVTAPGQEGPVEIAADADGRVLLPGFERAGEATLALGTAAAPRPWERLTVAVMDADLGDLRDAAALAREPVARDDARVARRRDPVTQLLYLVVACAAALGAWWFARREAGGASVGAEEAAWG
ncbi:MAG: hypothetical protein H6745_08350 [Deltaproteobacteria bacterium]|nr:hypothetical protein [Deltaproteobacteria bacterium]